MIMRCIVKYVHPRNGSTYYFVDFRTVDGNLKPVGCFLCHKNKATIFEHKWFANCVVKHLKSLGCSYCKIIFI